MCVCKLVNVDIAARTIETKVQAENGARRDVSTFDVPFVNDSRAQHDGDLLKLHETFSAH